MFHIHPSKCLSAALLAGLWLVAAVSGQDAAPAAPVAKSPPAPLVDAPLAKYRQDLLQLGFDAVSAMPTEPHQKNRARAQESLVMVCLQLDLPRLAEDFTAKIDDWRRGSCLAELALYCIDHGRLDAVGPLLAAADQVAEQVASDSQAWRRERIRAKIGRAHLLLGRHEKARSYAAGADAAELVDFEATMARLADPALFAAQLKAVDQVVAAGNFEPIRGALTACAELWDRYHDDDERRAQLETRVLDAYAKLPPGVRLGLVLKLVESAVRHGDRATAIRLLDRADALLGQATMQPEQELSQRADLAAWRGKASDRDKGRSAASATVARFYAQRDRIVDIYRAGVLRALATAYSQLGDGPEALRLFRAATEEGVLNPNSRPRAEDLAATCAAMALQAIEPDAELAARIQQVRKGLQKPW